MEDTILFAAIFRNHWSEIRQRVRQKHTGYEKGKGGVCLTRKVFLELYQAKTERIPHWVQEVNVRLWGHSA